MLVLLNISPFTMFKLWFLNNQLPKSPCCLMLSGNIEPKVVDIKKRHGYVKNWRVYLKFTYACLLHIKEGKPMLATKKPSLGLLPDEIMISRVEESQAHIYFAKKKRCENYSWFFFSSKWSSNDKSDLLAFGGVMKIGFGQLRKIL